MQTPTRTEREEVRQYIHAPGTGAIMITENPDGTWALSVGDHVWERETASACLLALMSALDEC